MNARRAAARLLLPAALAASLAGALPARGQNEAGLAPIPAPQGYVNDVAGVLPEPRRAQLEAFLEQLKQKTGVQFAVLTVTSTAPEEASVYKTRVFKQWGIGDQERDDGLLLLVAMEQREIRFETGYGLEGTLPDGWQARMTRDLMIPRFRAGEPGEGIIAGVLVCAQRIAAEKGVTLEWDGKELRYDYSPRGRIPPWVILLLFLLIFVVMPMIASGQRHRRGGGWHSGGWGGGFGGMGGGFGGGFGGGGGSSFGGFGGGSSGGGGGGGKW